MYDTIIIGGGIAGLTAGIYTARAGLSTLILEESTFGGQIVPADLVENYPGFDKISGFELSKKITEQTKNLGVELVQAKVDRVALEGLVKQVYVGEKIFESKTVIVASGARYKQAGFAGENELYGKGISYCATCDGFFYKGKDVFVIGAGNSAVHAAIYLSGIADRVNVVIRKDLFRCAKTMSDKLLSLNNVKVYFNTEVVAVYGDSLINEIVFKNNKTNETYNCKTDNNFGVFVYVGNSPNTSIFKEVLTLDDDGYIVSNGSCKTNVPGVFCAGDVRSKNLRQLVTASSDGAVAAMQVEKYISSFDPCRF